MRSNQSIVSIVPSALHADGSLFPHTQLKQFETFVILFVILYCHCSLELEDSPFSFTLVETLIRTYCIEQLSVYLPPSVSKAVK